MEEFRRNRIPAEIPPNSSAADEFDKENLQNFKAPNFFKNSTLLTAAHYHNTSIIKSTDNK